MTSTRSAAASFRERLGDDPVALFDDAISEMERAAGMVACARYDDIVGENTGDTDALENAIRRLSHARSGLLVIREAMTHAGLGSEPPRRQGRT